MLGPRDVIGQRSETVRRANLGAIVRELHLRGPQSRSELGVRTGLTRSAIRGLIGELAGAGVVEELPSASDGTPGRPSPLVRADPHAAVALGLEVNVDSLAAVLVGFGGTVHELRRVARPRGHLSLGDIVGDVVELAEPMVAGLRGDDALVGVGVGVAGIVRHRDGVVRLAPNLGWHDEPLGAALGSALGLPVPLSVANEADLAGLAEHRRGVAAGADAVLSITGEVGVGGNLVIDGRPLGGAAGYAGEVGHIPVNPLGTRCGCGSIGCWETEVGERALLVRAGRPADGGPAAVDEVILAARAGEPDALAAMDHVARWLGIGIAGLVNVMNPSLVVLGGLFQRLHPLVREGLEAVLRERALPPSRDLVAVVPGALGVDAPVLGAAEMAIEPFLADPAGRIRPARAAASA